MRSDYISYPVRAHQRALHTYRLFIHNFCLLLGLLITTQSLAAAPLVNSNRDFRFSTVDVTELEKIGVQRRIVQDNQGFMWFGGTNGLARFDGYGVKVYRNNPKDNTSLSYNEVTSMINDSRGRLWVGTPYGLNRLNKTTGGFVHYFTDSEDENYRLPSNKITALAKDKDNNIWVGTMRHGFSKIDGSSGHVEPITPSASRLAGKRPDAIRALLLDSDGLLWLGDENLGLCVFDPQTNELYYPKDMSGFTRKAKINRIIQGPAGNIWIGTSSSGLLRLDPRGGELKQYQHEPHNPNSLHHNTVWDLYFDNNNMFWVATDDSLDLYQPDKTHFKHFTRLTGTNLYGKVRALYQSHSDQFWLGMFPTGTAYLDQDATVFRNFQNNPIDTNSLSHSSVTAIKEDKHGNYWIGTEGGLDYFDTENQTIKHYIHEEGNPTSLPSNSILSLLIDKTDTLWVGTWKGGWVRFDDKAQTFIQPKMADGTTEHYKEEVWSMYEDKLGQLWVAGLYRYDRDNDQFLHYRQIYPDGDELSSPRVKVMYEDQHEQFWIGTIFGLDLFDRSTGKIKHYGTESSAEGLSDHFISSALEDAHGDLWFGTRSGGINKFNRETDTFTSIRAKDGLFDDSITGLIDDQNGSIWIISGSGLIRFHTDTQTFELYDRKNGLTGDLFHRNAIILSSRGEIVFGGANGLTILNPRELKENTTAPPVVLTELEVFNEPITPANHNGILKKPINFAKDVTLEYRHKVFSIGYSALNYRMPGQNKYAYILEGFDKDWRWVDNSRQATYTNLDPGSYVFKVKGSNNSGVWNNEGASINIRIRPAWWQTSIAYIIYFLFFALLLSTIYLVLRRLRQAKYERLVNAQLRKIDQMKDAFLANTSHELRTPLNGIIGLTETIIASPENLGSEDTLDKLRIVVSSGKRLSNIINDILDFSKLRNHEIELNHTPINLHHLVHSTLQLSETLVDQKSIKLINRVAVAFPAFLADEQRLSQILFNLIGNAVKFTEQGEVCVDAKLINDYIKITVADSGVGVSIEDCARIFLPFEQSLLKDAKSKTLGTGLGLAVTKNLVELHGGSITIDSIVGKGSTFIVILPYYKTNASPPPVVATKVARSFSVSSKNLSDDDDDDDKASSNPTPNYNYEKYRILIVDDEPVNRMVLKGYLTLNKNSVIVECSNGIDAIRAIKDDGPFDIVLLDVMMPGMSGYDVCREIRKMHSLFELPVFFLTAKSRVEDLSEGYQVGANDFLYKPVVKEELLGKISLHFKISQEFRKLSDANRKIDKLD